MNCNSERIHRSLLQGASIRDRFERTIGDLTLWMKHTVNIETFINRLGGFFHYEPLFMSSFSKN